MFQTRAEIAAKRDANLHAQMKANPGAVVGGFSADQEAVEMTADDIGTGYWKRARGGRLVLVCDD